jgi:hypothetical protein
MMPHSRVEKMGHGRVDGGKFRQLVLLVLIAGFALIF